MWTLSSASPSSAFDELRISPKELPLAAPPLLSPSTVVVVEVDAAGAEELGTVGGFLAKAENEEE